MILVGHPAPEFLFNYVSKENQIIKGQSFKAYCDHKKTLLFFYPLDFTFVCPSELLKLDQKMSEFKKENIQVLAISIDSEFAHLAWKKTPPHEGGIGPVQFDIAADVSHQIVSLYGIEHHAAKIALRACFLIDENGIVRSQMINDLPLGRNIDEILRLFDAIDHTQKHGEVCPANWSKGKKAMQPTSDGVRAYLKDSSHESH